jgi:hypothetical protein
MYRVLIVGLLTVVLGGTLLLRPTPASSAQSCATELTGNTCVFSCLDEYFRSCGSDPACLQANAAFIRAFVSTPAGTPACDALVAGAELGCGC